MKSRSCEHVPADVVVVGAGVAGLSVALGLAHERRRVHVLTKTALGTGGATGWAQGGIAAALGSDDAAALHAADTLAVAGGLADRRAVEILASGGPAAIARLQELGARFDRDGSGLALAREAAHSRRRIVHAKDRTGAEVLRTLCEAVRRAPGVRVFEHARACDLLLVAGGAGGVLARDPHGRLALHAAGAVVLATGGIGRVYRHTTNPAEATGDGLALGARAGLSLADVEFVQFHPTALQVGADPLPLLTEALRGQGASLVDEHGRRFMLELHSDGELAPRDVVARGIFAESRAGRRSFLDARAAIGARFPEAFPTVFEACQRYGLDPRSACLPVSPAAHYHMGGVLVDGDGRASLPGFYACGEVASTGVHGANRLASNSLLEALVFATRVAQALDATPARGGAVGAPDDWLEAASAAVDPAVATATTSTLRELMWNEVGLLRDERGLARAEDELERLATQLPSGRSDAHTLVTVAQLITAAARARRESRGAHFRTDFPEPDPAWQHRQVLSPPALHAVAI